MSKHVSSYPDVNRISTVAPSSALTGYNAYGSSVASWWSAHEEEILTARRECPNYWYDGLKEGDQLGPWMWQDFTEALAGCYSRAYSRSLENAGLTASTTSAMTAIGPAGPTATGEASLGVDLSVSGVGQAIATLLVYLQS